MPGTCQDPIGILLQWPVFLKEPFLGKTPAVHLGKESHQEICPHQDPTKKKTLLQDAGENLPWVPEAFSLASVEERHRKYCLSARDLWHRQLSLLSAPIQSRCQLFLQSQDLTLEI